jgi:hypothetical protein
VKLTGRGHVGTKAESSDVDQPVCRAEIVQDVALIGSGYTPRAIHRKTMGLGTHLCLIRERYKPGHSHEQTADQAEAS